MLTLDGLSCGYGAATAASGVSLEVPRGSIFALLGPNGAGKTSTILAVMGLAQVFGGRVLLEGEDITRRKPTERARLGMALVPEGRRVFADMSVMDNLAVGGYARDRGSQARSLERVYALFPRLAERRRQVAGSLSGGEQQMLAFGRALMAEPRLLFVDELSLGLMPKAVGLFLDVVLRLKGEGVTIVLVEQNTRRALGIADGVCVLAAGKPVFLGSAAEAAGAGEIFRHYLSGTV